MVNNTVIVSIVSSIIILILSGVVIYYAFFKKCPPCPNQTCPPCPKITCPPQRTCPPCPAPTPTPTPDNGSGSGDGSGSGSGSGEGSCIPDNGNWSTEDNKLNSACCQPPDYQILDPTYFTCEDLVNKPDQVPKDIKNCLTPCCNQVNNDVAADQDGNLDPSYGPMGRCGCALCCQNKKEPHFSKWGSCDQYITSEPAIANTPDTKEASSDDWRGFIGFGQNRNQPTMYS